MSIYFMTSLVYLIFATFLAAANAAFGFELLDWFSGLRWLRVHMITLGVIMQAAFGALPVLFAGLKGIPRPANRLDIWLLYNSGLVGLLVGIPLVNTAIIAVSGALVLLATALLIFQLRQIQLAAAGDSHVSPNGGRFYMVGLLYFLVGITVGAGLWTRLPLALAIQVPTEVHIHANTWGLMSFVFAGLIIDLYPQFAGRSLAWPGSINRIFWLMVAGSLGLLLWPWTGLQAFAPPGLIFHFAATIWLLLNVIRPLRGSMASLAPGIYHLVSAYLWFFAPLFFGPFILLGAPAFSSGAVEQNLPQAIIYGWVLQFGYAVLPYLFSRAYLGVENGRLGGSWFSLGAVHLGGLLLVASIFWTPIQNLLYGGAYVMWALSMLPVLRQLWQIARAGEQKKAMA